MNPPSIQFDSIVIGAGVIGLATARHLALTGRHTLLLESESSFGTAISSRNSEVIHAGIYYSPDSLKAKLCVTGNRALYAYSEAKNVSVRKPGKIIVAVTEDEIPILRNYQERALRNGVTDLAWLDKKTLNQLEPALNAVAGLFSPSTGIIDSHGLMAALLTDFEQAGGVYVANSPVTGGEITDTVMVLYVGGADPCTVAAPVVINAAGMGACRVAGSIQGFPAHHIPGLHFAIGHYFALSGRAPFRHLIYPVAVNGGLGIHLTLDLAGQPRFGPDLSWRETEDYRFDDTRVPAFYEAIRRYWPDLHDGALTPAYTGIRPKLWGPVQPDQDFMIQGPQDHGIAGLVNLFGMESPGLTCCLSIAEHVARLVVSSDYAKG